MLGLKLRGTPLRSPTYNGVMQGSLPGLVLFLLVMMAALALTLTGCGGSTSIDSRPVVEFQGADAPAALTMPCEGPVGLADKPMSAGETERTWARDRAALAACAAAQQAVVDFYKLRDKGLSGGH